MPVLKHAKKKLRQDKKRTLENLKFKETFKKLLKHALSNPTKEAVNAAFSGIDKAAKKNVIHKNKAARLKASLTRSVNTPAEKKVVTKKAKTTAAKKKTTKKTSKK